MRLAIANNDRMPGGTIAGVDLKYRDGKRDGAGMIFFNDEGDEDGGLVYQGKISRRQARSPAARSGSTTIGRTKRLA